MILSYNIINRVSAGILRGKRCRAQPIKTSVAPCIGSRTGQSISCYKPYSQLLNKNFVPYLIVFLFLVFAKVANSANEFKEVFPKQNHSAESVLQLTQEEQTWLTKHNTIRIAYDGSLPPYSFINEQGKIDGIAFEIMALLSKRLGINLTIYPNSDWGGLYKAGAKRKVDVIATMVNRAGRAEWFSFTRPYLTKSLVIVTKQDNPSINNRSDLADKKVALVKGYQYGEQLESEFPTVKRIKVKSMLDSLNEVDKGRADAAILFLGTANYLQTKHQLNQLKIAAFYERNSANESIAVRKDWPILREIMQKGLDSLTEEEVQKIFAKWVVQGGAASTTETTIKKVPEKAQPLLQPIIKKVIEIEQQPPNASIQNVVPKPTERGHETDKLTGAFLTILALLVLWFALIRKQNKKKRHAKNDMLASATHLASKQSPSVEIKDDQKNTQSQFEAVISPTIGQLGSTQQALPEFITHETVRYGLDSEGRFIDVGPEITDLLGYDKVDFMENYRRYLTDNPINQHWEGFVEAFMQGQPNNIYELEIFDANQDRHWLEVSGSPVYDGQGHCIGVEGTIRDITALRPGGILSATSPDYTGAVGNYPPQTLEGHLRLAIHTADERQQPLAIICMSLERLRLLDGNPLGFPNDEVCKQANKRLHTILRDTDTVHVLEANKYALILPETGEFAASLIVDKIRKTLQVPYLVDVQTIALDAKLGIAIYPDHGLEPESLIAKAELLSHGSVPENPVIGLPMGYGTAEDDSLRLQQDLVLALDECKVSLRASSPHNINALHRHSQFAVYYQSRHTLDDNTIKGFEGLIRWQHPELGLLLPAEFVDLVKDIGMFDVMTYWIIQQVSFQSLSWEEAGIRPKLMAINLSDLTGKQAVEVSRMANIVRETGAKTEWLVFSVPESEIATDPDSIMAVIDRLVEEGFAVAIDNFGTESSILPLLKTIPAQIIEIDPEFIRNLPDNAEDAAVVAYSVALLHDLGKTVIAKGIETGRQRDYLKTCGCDLIQGYLLSMPLPAKEAKALIEKPADFA